MIEEYFNRSNLLYGKTGTDILKNSSVAVCGIGGVGSFTAEALVRTGIGRLIIADCDKTDNSNINRQLFALTDTVGEYKTDAAKKRFKKINPDLDLVCINSEIGDGFDFDLIKADYICDAVDDVTAKLMLVEFAQKNGIKIISAMGCANKKDCTKLKIDKISKTSYCPLCKSVRNKMKKLNLNDFTVVYSTEQAECKITDDGVLPSSIFVPSVAGIMMANFVVNDLIKC